MDDQKLPWRFALISLALAALTMGASVAQTPSASVPSAPMQAVLTTLASLGGKPIETLTPAQARLQPSATDALLKTVVERGMAPKSMPVGDVADSMFHANGVDVPIRIYTPPGTGPFPVLVYFHGGGFVIADINTYDAGPRALADKAGTIVVSVGYSSSPERRVRRAALDAKERSIVRRRRQTHFGRRRERRWKSRDRDVDDGA